MRGLRAVLSIVDVAVWVGVGYLIYQSAGLVFGRLIGQGVMHIVGVALLSVVGTSLSIRALGRNLAQPTVSKGAGAMFSVWISRLFLVVMLVSFLVWDSYALWVGLSIVFPSVTSAARTILVAVFILYSAALVANYTYVFRNCPQGNRA